MPKPQTIARFLARHSALIALAIFAAAGIAVLDDYGVAVDEAWQRNTGYASLNYILGDADAPLPETDHNRFYGVAFEIPLIIAERTLGLEDSRSILLSRRLISHAFFLAAGFAASLLVYRLFASRLIALFATLVFLLHPRIYAHTFFNTKDPPFLAMFMVALYLIHRAFRRDSVWAFALCGAGVGLLTNIRVFGAMLFAAVLGMLALDLIRAQIRGDDGTRRVLANAAAFALTAVLTLYATFPILWGAPLALADAFPTLANHPAHIPTLFRGEWVKYPNIPWDFIPVWMLITTPPVALILAALGVLAIAWLCAARWRDALANTDARFGLLALACLTLPIAAVIAISPNLYNDWRMMHFLYAPLSVLAAFGLRGLSAIPKPAIRAAALGIAALGIAAVIVQMIQLRPYQNDYFNPLANRAALADSYQMDYWLTSCREGLERALILQPDGHVSANSEYCTQAALNNNRRILPPEDRNRLSINRAFPDFWVGRTVENPDWMREIYGVPIAAARDARPEARAAYRRLYDAAQSREPLFKAHFNIHLADGFLIYLKEPCAEPDTLGTFTASARPVHPDAVALQLYLDDFERRDFAFRDYGAFVDAACLMALRLPTYPLESFALTYDPPPNENREGRENRPSWSAEIPVNNHIAAYNRAMMMESEPAARSGGFDIYASANSLTYVKTPCAESDARGRFMLSAFPLDPSDLPKTSQDAGWEYEWLNFDFHRHGAIFNGKCVIVRDLPDFPITHLQAGQWTDGEGSLWSAKIVLDESYYDRYAQALAALPAEPTARADFDIYANDQTLIYRKTPCAESDARGRFFLSVFPVDPSDLPQSARERGAEHEPLNFDFHQYGETLNGDCVIIRDLPNYPISHIQTGQWTGTDSADNETEKTLWSVKIPLSGYAERYRRALADLPKTPAARADFDIYLNDRDRTLIYLKTPCAEPDTRGRFELSIYPTRQSDVEPNRRARNLTHNSLNFDFPTYGATLDGDKCAIIRRLPDYPINRIQTGQWIPDKGELWIAQIQIGETER